MKKILFVLVALTFTLSLSKSASAQQEVSVLMGVDVSVNLGEVPGADIGLRIEKKGLVTWEALSFFDTSKKQNSVAPGINAGWKAGESFAIRLGNRFGAIVGVDARYRNGGPWAKKTLWAVVGAGWRSESEEVRITYQPTVYQSHDNNVRILSGEVRLNLSERIGMSVREGLVFYHNDHLGAPEAKGWFQTANLTVALGKKNSGG